MISVVFPSLRNLSVLCVSAINLSAAKGYRRDAEDAEIAQSKTLGITQNTNFNCANNEYNGLLGLITSG